MIVSDELPETVIPALGEVVSSVSAADRGVVHVPLVCWKYRRDASKFQRRNRRLIASRVSWSLNRAGGSADVGRVEVVDERR